MNVLADLNQPFFNPDGSSTGDLPFSNFGYIEYQRRSALENITAWKRRWSAGSARASACVSPTPTRAASTTRRRNWKATPAQRRTATLYFLDWPERLRHAPPRCGQLCVGASLRARPAFRARWKFSPTSSEASARRESIPTLAAVLSPSARAAALPLLDKFGAVAATPNQVGTPHIVGNVDCWFFASNDKIGTRTPCLDLAPGLSDAYQLQSAGFLGNVGRNTLRGPHTSVFDFAFMRDFPIHESLGLQFRWEVFNLANAVLLGQPSTNISSSSVGQITSSPGIRASCSSRCGSRSSNR
jgi:hypothetical protein